VRRTERSLQEYGCTQNSEETTVRLSGDHKNWI
jgi:hypothetical protein